MRLLAILCCLVFVQSVSAELTGRVLEEGSGRGVPSVLVTDGLHVVSTDTQGRFSLPGHAKQRFVVTTTPSLFKAVSPFFLRIAADVSSYDFHLRTLASQSGQFIHVADTETFQYHRWIDDLKDVIRNDGIDFLAVTGDLCYEKGLIFHSQHINDAAMGTRVVCTLGNHDLVAGQYGEEIFESLFGPVWYSFDAAGTHYVVLPMLGGDKKPSYTKEDIVAWLRNDLNAKVAGMPVVVFCHDLWFANPGNAFTLRDEQGNLSLEEYQLKAWIYGHWHDHVFKEMNAQGVKTYCSAPPDKGGIDHSPACYRLFHVDTHGEVVSDTRYTSIHDLCVPVAWQEGELLCVSVNTYDSRSVVRKVELTSRGQCVPLKQRSAWNWAGRVTNDGEPWQVRAELASGTVLVRNVSATPRLKWTANLGACTQMTPPVFGDGRLFAATIDDDQGKRCGIIALDAASGVEMWRFPTQSSVKNTIAYSEKTVVACDIEGTLYAIDAVTGVLRWQKNLHSWLLSPYQNGVVVHQGVVYAGCGTGLSALALADGALIWKSTSTHAEPTCARHTLGGNVLLTGAFWRAREAFAADSGKRLWALTDADARFCNASPLFDDGSFYYTGGTTLYQVAATTGEMIRSEKLDVSLESAAAPFMTQKHIVLSTGDSGVVALDRATLKKVWQFRTSPTLLHTVPYKQHSEQTVEATMMLQAGRLYFGGGDGYFYCLDESKGAIVWRASLGAPILAESVASESSILVVDFGGTLYSFANE